MNPFFFLWWWCVLIQEMRHASQAFDEHKWISGSKQTYTREIRKKNKHTKRRADATQARTRTRITQCELYSMHVSQDSSSRTNMVFMFTCVCVCIWLQTLTYGYPFVGDAFVAFAIARLRRLNLTLYVVPKKIPGDMRLGGASFAVRSGNRRGERRSTSNSGMVSA